MSNDDTIHVLRDEVKNGLDQVDALAIRIGALLATAQAENVRLAMENQRLRQELARVRGTLSELRQVVKGLRKQEAAFRAELVREMTYTAELTETIETFDEGEEGDWETCEWEETA